MHTPDTPPFVPLASWSRDGLDERQVFGAIALARPEAPLGGAAAERVVYARSLAKPLLWRALAPGLRGATPATRAVAAASHHGDAPVIALARALVPLADRWALATPADRGMGPTAPQRRHPTRWRHPCSGEHAAILATCRALGWPLQGYTETTHPFHASSLAALRETLGATWTPTATAIDGCGLPTFAMPLSDLARAFAALIADPESPATAMMQHPEVVGGRGRLDTALMIDRPGRLVAKEGADGLLGVGVQTDDGTFLGLAIKLAHGWDPPTMSVLARAALNALGIDVPAAQPAHRQRITFAADLLPKHRAERWPCIEGTTPTPNRSS